MTRTEALIRSERALQREPADEPRHYGRDFNLMPISDEEQRQTQAMVDACETDSEER